MAGQLYAAAARADITPPVGIPHGGWGAQLHERAEGIDLRLWATVLVVRDDDGREAAIIDLDLCLLDDDQAGAVREAVSALTGIPRQAVRCSYTHTHAAPVTARITGGWIRAGRELVRPYVESLPGLVAGAAWEAQRRLRPAQVAAGTGSCAINVNRRVTLPDGRVIVGKNPAGNVDHTVTVVRIDDRDEAPIATLVHYSCHPIILGPENRVVTAEYPGEVKRVVEASLGGHCLFLQGCCGDIGPVQLCVADLATCRRLGRQLGHEAARVAWAIRTQPLEEQPPSVAESGAPLGIYPLVPSGPPDTTLRLASGTVALPLRSELGDPARLEAEAQAQEEALYALRARGAPPERIREQTMVAKRAAMRAERALALAGRDRYELEVQGIRLGPVGLVGVAVEPFLAIGQAVRARSPLPFGLLSGYTNGYRNYLPTAEEFARGGYEVDISPFTPEGARLLEDAAVAVLNRMT